MRDISLAIAFLATAATVRAGQTATADGITAFRDGHYSVAVSKLRETKDSVGLTFLALAQAATGDYQAALHGLEHVKTGDKNLSRIAAIAQVKCLIATGNDAQAFTRVKQLEQQFPNDADVLYTAAKLYMKAFNDTTYAMFQHTPASYRVHELSAEIFEVQNRYEDAAAEYHKAIELNPAATDLHFRLGRAILLKSHDPKSLDAAAEEFQKELKVSPEDSASEFQLGQIAQVKGNAPDAKAHFERAVSFSPSFVQALIALGKIRAQEKNYPEAIALLSRATDAQPNNETAHYALLTAYRNSGQVDKAKAEKATLDRLQRPPEGEFSDFLKKLGEKPPEQ